MQAPPTAEQGSTASFFPVHIDSVENDVLQMDIYLRYGSGETTLYRDRGIAFADSDRQRLVEQGIEFLYVPMSQHGEYRRALSKRLEVTFKTPDKSKAERGRMVRASCCRMVEDAMLFPGNAGAIGAIEEVGQLFARLAREDESNFSYILDMSEHDYYTITHMVNVGIGCGLLVRELRPDDEALIATVIQGGLLHDIGKRGVPPEVLNKEGKLTDDEWGLIKKHPSLGYDELLNHHELDRVILEMTRDHHERPDGKGYPAGISGSEISFAARLCAVVDVYDAITAARPYRGPIAPVEALRIMSEGIGTQFDETIFAAWRTMVERLLRDDPDRAPKHTGSVRRSLKAVTQMPAREPPRVDKSSMLTLIAATSDELPQRREGVYSGERRLHPRRACDLLISATFERQMKESVVKPGQRFEARVLDLSRGGVQLQTPWPLSQNDILSIEFKSGEGIVRRRVRVVRVRKHSSGAWIAGACFIAEEMKKSA